MGTLLNAKGQKIVYGLTSKYFRKEPEAGKVSIKDYERMIADLARNEDLAEKNYKKIDEVHNRLLSGKDITLKFLQGYKKLLDTQVSLLMEIEKSAQRIHSLSLEFKQATEQEYVEEIRIEGDHLASGTLNAKREYERRIADLNTVYQQRKKDLEDARMNTVAAAEHIHSDTAQSMQRYGTMLDSTTGKMRMVNESIKNFDTEKTQKFAVNR